MNDEPETKPCANCGAMVTEHARNVGGSMQVFCPTGGCDLALERAYMKRRAAERKERLSRPVSSRWDELRRGGVGRWIDHRWFVTFKSDSEKRWELYRPDYPGGLGTWFAGGRCRSRAEGWRMACAVANTWENGVRTKGGA